MIARKHVNWFLQKSDLKRYTDLTEFNKLGNNLAQLEFLKKIRKKLA